MQFTKSKDTCSDTLLPPSFEDSCKDQETAASCYHVHVKHLPGGTHTVEQTSCCANGPSQEKTPFTDVPLNSEQLAMMYNKEVPPPYESDPSQQAVWSTEASKVHPGKPRIVGRDCRRLSIFCRGLIVFICTLVGVYLCLNGVSAIIGNNVIAYHVNIAKNEALSEVHEVDDIDNIPEEYEGKLIHLIGPLNVAEPLEYDECGISVSSVKLRRTLDMSHEFTNKSYYEPYFMSQKWPQTRLAEDQFCRGPTEYMFSENPAEQIADVVKIGAFKLGHRLKEKFIEFYVVTEKLMLIDSRTAFQVMYSDAGRNNHVHSVIGRLDKGSIEPYESLDFYTVILQRESAVSAYDMIADRVSYRMAELNAENWWSYVQIAVGMLIPLIAILHFVAVVKAMKKNKRNHVMLSMPVQ